MMDPEIARLLAETEKTLALVSRHQTERGIAIAIAGIVLAVVLRYAYERWTFIPRKRHIRVFNERF